MFDRIDGCDDVKSTGQLLIEVVALVNCSGRDSKEGAI